MILSEIDFCTIRDGNLNFSVKGGEFLINGIILDMIFACQIRLV